jgi:multidrug efflux pump subunit AcrA (membrane-fusion protein)
LRLPGGALRLIGWSVAVILVFAVSVGLVWAHSLQIHSQGILLQQSNALGPRVLVMQIQHPDHSRSISFPASIHGYIETPIYAKTAGYLKTIYVDKGDPASVSVTQYPGRSFSGTVTRHPEALTQDTRTMRFEVDLPNKDSALYPGMYATLTLNVGSSDIAPWVPDDALIFRDGDTYVPVLRKNRIHLARVALGNDDGREVQVASGLSKDDLIAVNVGQGVEEGDPVQAVALAGAD